LIRLVACGPPTPPRDAGRGHEAARRTSPRLRR
jgi:hypothetical protein